MAAVSIQLTPRSTARWMAAIERLSSCGPQPNDQPPPPAAQEPKPTVVISRPLVPSGRVGSDIMCLQWSRSAAVRRHGSGQVVGERVAQGPALTLGCAGGIDDKLGQR